MCPSSQLGMCVIEAFQWQVCWCSRQTKTVLLFVPGIGQLHCYRLHGGWRCSQASSDLTGDLPQCQNSGDWGSYGPWTLTYWRVPFLDGGGGLFSPMLVLWVWHRLEHVLFISEERNKRVKVINFKLAIDVILIRPDFVNVLYHMYFVVTSFIDLSCCSFKGLGRHSFLLNVSFHLDM